MDKHPVDKLFHSRLKNVERKPNPQAWGKLEGLIAENQAKKKRKGFVIWMSVAASIILLVTALGIFLPEYYGNSANSPRLSQSPAPQSSEQLGKNPSLVQSPKTNEATKPSSTDLENSVKDMAEQLSKSEPKRLPKEIHLGLKPEKNLILEPDLEDAESKDNLAELNPEELPENNAEASNKVSDTKQNNPAAPAKKKYIVKVTVKLGPNKNTQLANNTLEDEPDSKRLQRKGKKRTKPKIFGIQSESILASIGK